MEIFFSAVLGDLTTRSINFIINKYSKPSALAVEDSLQRALFRAQVIINEAMGCSITNQSMLRQLNMLRGSMHRGYYTLDAFRCKPCDEESKYQVVSRSSSLSKVNFVKRLYFPSKGAQALEELQEALDHLSSMILDMNELIQFLRSYPRVYRQPYSMHLLLANCMFGRQMEAEHLINFLLHTQPRGAEELEVLPIVGPARVGKSTLVAHVCKDERVRDHFSKILFLHEHDFTDCLASLGEGCQLEHQGPVLNSSDERRVLVVVDLVGDLSEDAWKKLYSAAKRSMQRESKIIVTSRSNKIIQFGTTQALTLEYPSHDAYWYFFKTLTFGSTDPKLHPRFTHLAMEIAKTQKISLIGAHITACLLRDNFDIQFWWKVLSFWRGFIQKHVSSFGEHPFDFINQNRPARFGRMTAPSEDLVIYRQYQRSSEQEVAEIRVQDVIYGGIRPHGRFEVLAWRSQIPPYYSYVYTCEIQDQKTNACKRKRL